VESMAGTLRIRNEHLRFFDTSPRVLELLGRAEEKDIDLVDLHSFGTLSVDRSRIIRSLCRIWKSGRRWSRWSPRHALMKRNEAGPSDRNSVVRSTRTVSKNVVSMTRASLLARSAHS